jgi:hypothetical protein
MTETSSLELSLANNSASDLATIGNDIGHISSLESGVSACMLFEGRI